MKIINRILLNGKYTAIAFMICYSLWISIKFSPPFSFSNNTNVALRIIFSSISVIIIPGYLIFNLMQLKRRYEMDLFELLAISFGISFVLIEILCIVTFETNLNSFKAAMLLLITSFVLLLFNFFLEKKSRLNYLNLIKPYFNKVSIVIYIFVVLFIIITSILLYRIESPIASSEDQLHISIIRKILENNTISKTNILYKPEIAYTYLYPGLHFIIAMISKFSALDPIMVYAKLRFVLGVLSLLLIWSFSKALFRDVYIAFAITLTCLALIFNGSGANIPGFYCGQLVPVSHISDISMGILMPVTLIFAFQYILDEGIFNKFFFLFLFLFMAAMIIHTREGIQILFYFAVTALTYILFNRNDKKTIYKISIVIFAIFLLGNIYKMIHSYNLKDINVMESESKKKFIQVFKDLSRNPKLALSTPDKCPDVKAFVPGGKLVFKKYVSFGILIALLALAFFGRTFWGLFMSSSIIASLFFMRLNILATMLVILTYSEIMYSPARFILYFTYISFGFFVFIFLLGLDRIYTYVSNSLRNVSPNGILLVLWFVFVYFSSYFLLLRSVVFMQEALYRFGTLLLAVFGILAVIAASSKSFEPYAQKFQESIFRIGVRKPLVGVVNLFFVLCPLVLFGGGQENKHIFEKHNIYGPAVSIFDEYKKRTAIPDITDFSAYCEKSDFFNVPVKAIDFIRENIPAGNIFAYARESKKVFYIPLFANQYIAVAPEALAILIADKEYLNSYKNKKEIIFNEVETEKEKLQLIDRFKFTYIIITPEYRYLTKFFDKYDCFSKIFEKDSFLIYHIDRDKLKVFLEKKIRVRS